MEIGSEFWIDNFPNEYKAKKPEWINRFGYSKLTFSGRGAISLLLEEINPKIKIALLPAYTCETVVLPFIEHGYTCFFYDINADMTPNIASIEKYRDIGVFLHMGFYGFSTNCGLSDVINKFKDENTIVVEDITHTLFSDYQRFDENDYYVSSIRKWMGLPSGGFLASKNPISSNLRINEDFASYRKEALQLKARYMINGNELLKQRYLDLFAKGEELLDGDLTPYDMDDTSRELISILDSKWLKEKRRSNFMILLESLKEVDYLHPVFNSIPDGICPMFYPVYIKEERNQIRQKLIEQKIYCPIHWPVPKHIKLNNLKNAEMIYSIVLSIPCDQRYEEQDMARIVSVIKELRI